MITQLKIGEIIRIGEREYILSETSIGGCEKLRPTLLLLNNAISNDQRANKKMTKGFKGIKLSKIDQ